MRPFLLALAVTPLLGFVPFAHEGMAVMSIDGEHTQGRALFSTDASSRPNGVLLRATFPLKGGAEAYLVIDFDLVKRGKLAPSQWQYYEKVNRDLIGFQATGIVGDVLLVDRFERGGETSLYIELSAELSDGSRTRYLTDSWAVTAPSPSVLRESGSYTQGVVVVDNGSGARHTGYSDYDYHHGVLDCYGYPDDTTVGPILSDDVDTVITNDEVVVIYDDNGDEVIDETDYTSDGETDDAYAWPDTTDDDVDCSADTEDSYDSTTDDSDSDSDWDCVGDAEARVAPAGVAFVRAPLWTRAERDRRILARRIVTASPMLLLLLGLLLWPRRRPAPVKRST